MIKLIKMKYSASPLKFRFLIKCQDSVSKFRAKIRDNLRVKKLRIRVKIDFKSSSKKLKAIPFIYFIFNPQICYRCPNALTQTKTFVVRGRHCAGDVLLTDKTIDILSSRSKQLNVIGNCITWSMPANSQYGEFVCLKY